MSVDAAESVKVKSFLILVTSESRSNFFIWSCITYSSLMFAFASPIDENDELNSLSGIEMSYYFNFSHVSSSFDAVWSWVLSSYDIDYLNYFFYYFTSFMLSRWVCLYNYCFFLTVFASDSSIYAYLSFGFLLMSLSFLPFSETVIRESNWKWSWRPASRL